MPAQAPPAHLMLALAAVVLLGAHGAAAQVPQVPSWARLRTDATTSQRTALLNWNRMLVSHANSSNATFDLAWWAQIVCVCVFPCGTGQEPGTARGYTLPASPH